MVSSDHRNEDHLKGVLLCRLVVCHRAGSSTDDGDASPAPGADDAGVDAARCVPGAGDRPLHGADLEERRDRASERMSPSNSLPPLEPLAVGVIAPGFCAKKSGCRSPILPAVASGGLDFNER